VLRASAAPNANALKDAVLPSLIWMIGPVAFRFAALFPFLSFFGNWHDAVAACSLVLLVSLPQDLFIATQAVLLVLAARAVLARFWPKRAGLCLGLWATALFAALHLYLLADFLLFQKTGVRMNPAFLEFLPGARAFVTSAMELAPSTLTIGLAAIVVSLVGVFSVVRRTRLSGARPSQVAMLMAATGLLSVLARHSLPAIIGYPVENLLLSQELRLVEGLVDSGPHMSAEDEAAALRMLAPRAEDYEYVSADYPLLKHTRGFSGQKQFEIDVRPGERPHVVLLFMESFRAADVGVLGGKHGASPEFDRLSKEGVLFANFYSCGVQTTRAVTASLFGILPCFSEKSAAGGRPRLPLIGIADLLNGHGYTSAYISATSLDFEHKGEFFANHGYAEVIGQDDVAAAIPDAEPTPWGYHDEYLFQYVADWLRDKDCRQQPAFLTVFTVSNHHPFQTPDSHHGPDFPNAANPTHASFLRTFHYSDHCLGQFLKALRKTGLDRRTVLFVLGDHGISMGEHDGNLLSFNRLYGENVHVPLLVLAPGRIKKPAVIRDVASQVDLLPTVMDVLGLTGRNHSIGTSLMRHVPDRTAFSNNPFGLQFLALRQGRYNYIYTVRSHAPALFDVAADPGEYLDVTAAHLDVVEPYHAAVTAANRLFLRLYINGRFVGP
jgi:arylsulfatase A-like enzyme